MKEEKITICLKRIFCLALSLILGVVLSCAGIRLESPFKEADTIPSDEEITEKRKDRLQKAYSSFTMASIHMAYGRYEEAKGYLHEALGHNPDSIYLNQKMAVLLKEMKDYRTASEYARKGLDLDPENVRSRILMAEIYSASGDEESAIREYEKTLEFDPDQQRVRLILISILIRKGQYNPALMHLDKLIQQDSNMLMAHYYRGRINLELKNYPEAEKSYLDALELNRRMEPALFDLGRLYEMLEKYENAAEIYERLLSFYPNNIIARDRLISIYYELGQEEIAEKQIEEIKKQSKPGDPGRQALGLIYLRHGKLDESIAELDLIVSAWPEDHKSRYYLATAYEEKEELDKALHHFRLINEESEYFVKAQMHVASSSPAVSSACASSVSA